MSAQMISEDSSSAISSPVSAAGASRSGLPASVTMKKSGRVPARARRSAKPVKRTLVHAAQAECLFRMFSEQAISCAQHATTRGTRTRDIYGPNFPGSSGTAILQLSLANRLHQRMDLYGSLEYVLTWKVRAVLLGPPICALRASAAHIFAKDSGGWRSGWSTPTSTDGTRGSHPPRPWDTGVPLDQMVQLAGWPTPDTQQGGGRQSADPLAKVRPSGKKKQFNLADAAALSAWPTPKASDGHGPQEGPNRQGSPGLNTVAQLAGWPTPQTCEAPNMGKNRGGGKERARITPQSVAQLVGWGTPRVTTNGGHPSADLDKSRLEDQAGSVLPLSGWATHVGQDASNTAGPSQFERNSHPLNVQAVLAAHGMDSTSSPVQTAKRGVLNPAHSRWLMGFPAVWDSCGVTAMRSCLKKPQSSSKPTTKPAGCTRGQ